MRRAAAASSSCVGLVVRRPPPSPRGVQLLSACSLVFFFCRNGLPSYFLKDASSYGSPLSVGHRCGLELACTMSYGLVWSCCALASCKTLASSKPTKLKAAAAWLWHYRCYVLQLKRISEAGSKRWPSVPARRRSKNRGALQQPNAAPRSKREANAKQTPRRDAIAAKKRCAASGARASACYYE